MAIPKWLPGFTQIDPNAQDQYSWLTQAPITQLDPAYLDWAK